MVRSYPIFSITPSGEARAPGRIKLSGAEDLTELFKGKYYWHSLGLTKKIFEAEIPDQYVLVQATTFDVVGTKSYNGTYTVYTSRAEGDPNKSSVFVDGKTEIVVNEVLKPPVDSSDAENGFVTNISTCLVDIAGEYSKIVPPMCFIDGRPVLLVGRGNKAFTEIYNQNLIKLAQNFASSEQPAAALLGQLWFNTSNSTLNVYTGSSWVSLSSSNLESLADFDDVNAAGLINGQHLVWNSVKSNWIPKSPIYKPAPLKIIQFNGTSIAIGSVAQHNNHYRCTSDSDITISIFNDSEFTGTAEFWDEDAKAPFAPLPVGARIIFSKHGSGSILFSPAAGVTISGSTTLLAENGKVELIKVGSNTYDLYY